MVNFSSAEGHANRENLNSREPWSVPPESSSMAPSARPGAWLCQCRRMLNPCWSGLYSIPTAPSVGVGGMGLANPAMMAVGPRDQALWEETHKMTRG